MLVISTHIADVCNHSDEMAMTHARIFSVTLIFISWRILSSAKVLYEAFGLLVVSIELIFKNVVVWFLVYAGIWIPLSKYQKHQDIKSFSFMNFLKIVISNSLSVLDAIRL